MRISDWSSDVCSSDLVLRPAPEKLAQRPEEESSDDRTRQASVPRLARLLWRLINLSGLNRTLCLSDENPEHSISDAFKTLAIDAQRVEIAPGIEPGDRNGVVEGKSVSVRVAHGGGRKFIKKIHSLNDDHQQRIRNR